MKKMVYPILTIEKNGMELYAFRKSKNFSIADEELVRKLGFEGLRIIDSKGTEFKINSFERIGWGTFFMGYSLFTKGRQIKLKFNVEKIDNHTLDELKVITATSVKVGKEKSELPEGSRGLIRSINETSSIEELIELFY
ncbi:MAG: hypothetical protein CL840_08375 [Crocinitomicaceae bacterium]|nr:hypothetical protein [Crocinitomicaceae bacterium]|tara:strand:- start:3161 stop:3577 length:417 start_codon:yes stop_codon:yes gene_type:complete